MSADLDRSPLVSVILPTYNRAQLLPRAMRSVLNQSYRNLELIVVDDGSNDGTERLVRSVEDSRVRYVSRANGGPAAARNTGVELARGDFVAFQDSDDEWLDGKLERQVQVLSNSGDRVILCLCSYIISLEGQRAGAARIGAGQLVHANDVRRQTLENFYFPTPTWLVRRVSLLQSARFDTELRCWEDWELAIRLSDLGEFVLVDDILHLQHFTRGGVNSDKRARMKSMARILQVHERRWASFPRTLAEHHYTVGRLALLHGTPADARHHLWRTVSANRQHFKAWARLAMTLLGAHRLRQVMDWRRKTLDLRRRSQALGPRNLD